VFGPIPHHPPAVKAQANGVVVVSGAGEIDLREWQQGSMPFFSRRRSVRLPAQINPPQRGVVYFYGLFLSDYSIFLLKTMDPTGRGDPCFFCPLGVSGILRWLVLRPCRQGDAGLLRKCLRYGFPQQIFSKFCVFSREWSWTFWLDFPRRASLRHPLLSRCAVLALRSEHSLPSIFCVRLSSFLSFGAFLSLPAFCFFQAGTLLSLPFSHSPPAST